MPSAYDLRLALRAFALGALVALIAVCVVATTDEGLGWARRAAMCAALAPVAGSAGALAAARIAVARGEARALEALGAHPLRVLGGALIGGAFIGALGAAVVASGRADVASLFPEPAEARVWTADQDAGARERTLGIRLGPHGALSFAPEGEQMRSGSEGADRRAPVGSALIVLAFAGPLWAVQRGNRLWRGAALALLVVAAIASFQFAAAHRASAWVVCGPPLALLAHALASRYRAQPSL